VPGDLNIFNDAVGPTDTKVVFFASGGDPSETYTVVVRMTTTGGQVKEDTILFAVRNP
jgi:hypothetical protein